MITEKQIREELGRGHTLRFVTQGEVEAYRLGYEAERPQPPRSISRERVREIASSHSAGSFAIYGCVEAAIIAALRELGINVEDGQ